MADFDRQKKVIDMMLTAHSVLRDKYLSLSSFFENFLLIAAAILNAFVFIDVAFITKMTNLNEEHQKLIIGIASIIVFAISVVLLQVKWKEKAENHERATGTLFALLQESRQIKNMQDGIIKDNAIEEFEKKYASSLEGIVKIPERKFNSLKLIHCRKIELSKLIDKHPGSRLFILKIKLLFSSFKKKPHF